MIFELSKNVLFAINLFESSSVFAHDAKNTKQIAVKTHAINLAKFFVIKRFTNYK